MESNSTVPAKSQSTAVSRDYKEIAVERTITGSNSTFSSESNGSEAKGGASSRDPVAGGSSMRVHNPGHWDPQPLGSGRRKPGQRAAVISRIIVDNKAFIFFTTVLTLYALTGDDVRLLFTDKPQDIWFNIAVLFCMAVFFIEVILSCLGKSDYWLGFFFWLDVISTISLVLDLTPVSEWVDQVLSGGDDGDDNASNLRSGKTARVGARASRAVRVLRLIRIIKLYKNFYQATVQKKLEGDQKRRRNKMSDDEWDEEELDDLDREQLAQEESRVGKKLSEMTTRRVIMLILAMLIVIPFLAAQEADQVGFSPSYGADHVWEAFTSFQGGSGTREDYEKALLQFVYYHNWFANVDPESYCGATGDACANLYYGHLFWVGISGRSSGDVKSSAQDAVLQSSSVETWENSLEGTQEGIYNYGRLPTDAQEILASNWSLDCDEGDVTRRGISLLSRRIDGVVSYAVTCPVDLRWQEQAKYGPQLLTKTQYDAWHLTFYFDMRPYVRMDSYFNLAISLFVMLLLIMGSLMFSHDANRLVLHPVENMIKRVEAIRENPLIAIKMADDEFKAEEMMKYRDARMSKQVAKKLCKDLITCDCECLGRKQEVMETVILEKTIIKLGSLLALGFGEAGANIIGQNMFASQTAGVNAMIAGTRVDCVIGVVRIRDFNTTNEVLQAKVMTFGNQIAEIVHGVCNEFHGAPNKNNGDTFLIIWRVGQTGRSYGKLAEMSVVAFATILGALHRSPLLGSYRSHPGLQMRLGENCRVNLSFGLHAGWAIEGAVGSEYKIDASYLSPNVSIATSIELATETYGVPLMVAQSVVQLCGKRMRSLCRLIDRVVIRGSADPLDLYCVDLDYMSVKLEESKPLTVPWNTRKRFQVRQFMETQKSRLSEDSVDLADVFADDPNIKSMRERYTTEFFQLFNMGYQNYAQGEWMVAKRMLSCSRSLLGADDGPSTALLRFMQTPYQFQAPKEWKGYRDLVIHSGTRRTGSL